MENQIHIKKPITFLFLFFLVINFTNSFAQVNTVDKYVVDRYIDTDGKEVEVIIVPGKPPDHYQAPVALPTEGAIMLLNVPAFNWCYGCSATAAAMAAGFYDNNGYSNIYTGPINNGVCPLDNSSWPDTVINGEQRHQCPLSATVKGIDGRTTNGHVDDYWISYYNWGPDPWVVNNWTEHIHEDCTADFMGTSQSQYSAPDGGTYFYFNSDGSPKYNYTGCEPSRIDGCHGMRDFYESRMYSVQTNYNQRIYGNNGNTQGYSLAQFQQAIDDNQPVVIQVSGHSMLGVGYESNSDLIYINNTWDYDTHSMTWGGSYSGLQHYGVSVVVLEGVKTTVSSNTVCPDSVIVPIIVSNFNDITLFSIDLNYLESQLNYYSYQNPNPELNAGNINVTSNNGHIEISWNSSTPVNIANDTLIELIFNVIPVYSQTTTNLTWDQNNCTYINSNNDTIVGLYNNGYLMINPVPEDPGTIIGETELCQEPSVQTYLTGIIANADTYTWTLNPAGAGNISGSGTSINVDFDPVFTGQTELSVCGTNNCGNGNISILTINVNAQPMVNAGSDDQVCEGNSYTLIGNATNYQTILWTNPGGDGTFDDPTELNTIYTPSIFDIINGSITLTLTAYAIPPCTINASDDIVLTIQKAPTSDAGNDEIICKNQTITLSGIAENAQSVFWESNGDGIFSDEYIINPVYTPGTNDLANDSVILILNSGPISPCNNPAEDDMILYFNEIPEVNAGADQEICSNGFAGLFGNANNYDPSTISWTSDNGGSFSSTNNLTTDFTPSQQQIDAGFANLTLSVAGFAPCDNPVTDEITITIIGEPLPFSGGNDEICETASSYSLSNATVEDNSSVYWQTTGDGSFIPGETILNPEYHPGTEDYTNGIVELTLYASPNSPCTNTNNNNMELAFRTSPTVYAGSDSTICDTEYIDLIGIATNFDSTSVEWTSLSGGTFSDNYLLNSTFYPSELEIANGSATIILIVEGYPCIEIVSDTIEITILSGGPLADAGSDITMCETTSYITITGTSANCYSSLQWNSSGDGVFSPSDTILEPKYWPGNQDILNGGAVLSLCSNPIAPCQCSTIDSANLFINILPTANAGDDTNICKNEDSYAISGTSASNYSSLEWTSSGTGMFPDPNIIEPVYFPSSSDKANDSILLILEVLPLPPCSTSALDTMVLYFSPEPTINAGLNQTICANSSVSLSATATNYDTTSVLWTSLNSGTFSNNYALSTSYYPSTNEVIAGYATIIISIDGLDPCNYTIYDTLNITINPEPTAFAGGNETICNTIGSYSLDNSAATNYSGLIWNSDGDGSFTPTNTILHPNYHPGTNDSIIGSVILTLTALPNAPCSDSINDEMILSFSNAPEAYAGANAEICEGDTYTINDGWANNYNTIIWMTNGSGSFASSNTPNPTYTPSTGDISLGSVTLTIYAIPISPCSDTTTDEMNLTITLAPIADAGDDGTICAGSSFTLNGNASNYSSYTWTHTGTGNLSLPNSLTPTYTPSTQDITNGSVIFTLTVNGNDSCDEATSDQAELTINQEPTADAGNDRLICEDGDVIIGSASNYSSITWTTDGDGFFSNDTIENPYYTPGSNDVINGSVIITITVHPLSPCTTIASDYAILTINANPTANAGGDDEICESTSEYFLGGASATNYSTISWTSAGSGSFSNTSIVNPFYYPSNADVSAGFADLTITAYNPPCNPVESTMRLTIYSEPTVDAGTSQTICVNDLVTLSDANADNYSSLMWIAVDGSGTFSNPTILNPIYSPSASDYLQASVNLRLTAYPNSPCTSTVYDDIIIIITQPPTANTGLTTETICESESYFVTTATATNYSSVGWISSGDGSFTNQNTFTPTYTPGLTDIITGSAILTLSAQPKSPCGTPAESEFTLFIESEPDIFAGNDEFICEGNMLFITSSTAEYYNTLLWTTTGSGSFDNNATLHPIYIPSSADISVGNVTLQLAGTSNSPCSAIITDEMLLTITSNVEAYAGSDASICGDESYYYIFNANATDYSSISWTTSGDGYFNDPSLLKPNYIPGSADIIAGNVTLEITAISISPCTGFVTDQMVLLIDPMPIVEAGPDDVVCDASAYTCIFSSVENEDFVLWTSTGTGTFNNPNLLHPTYLPSSADLLLGSVYLKIIAYGNQNCLNNTVSDSLELSFELSPTSYAGPDEAICENGITISNAIAENFNTLLWTSNGSSGTLINENTLTPTYTPSAQDITNGSVTLTLTANPNSPCTNPAMDEIVFTIHEIPVVDAGVDASICETESYYLSGSATDYSSLTWTTSGDGTFLNNNTLFPTYEPGINDIINGIVTITLTAQSISPCTDSISDNMTLIIESLSEVNAGNSSIICVGETFITTEAWAINWISLLWTSSGSGTFDNPNVLNTVYTPSSGDIANGSFTLTLTATSSAVCGNTNISDDIYVAIQEQPTVDAGSDPLICAGNTYTVNDASATNYSSILWTTSGDGTFINQSTEQPTYTPGTADITTETVTLTMTVSGLDPCNGIVQDQMIITINPGPSAYAGEDDETCENESYTITNATAEDYSTFQWTTDGSGNFTNANTLSPTYWPDAGDIANGTVIIRLTAYPTTPCIDEVYDEMTLSIIPLPEVYAGNDSTICGDVNNFNLFEATSVNHQSIEWTTSGTGIFSNKNSINPFYYPSNLDITNGGVVLTITAYSNNPCTINPYDYLTLTIEPAAIADAGDDEVSCYNTNHTISTASASNYSSLLWTHTGAGTLINSGTINPTYIPDISDAGTSIVLTLTVYGITYCGDASDQMTLQIINEPEVNAGPDATTCANIDYEIVNTTASSYSNITWSTSGTGVFDNPNILHPIYVASNLDILNGNVVLTITVDAIFPCTNNESDEFILYFTPAPIVEAGNDETICEGELITITSASGSYTSSYQWTTSGSGTFISPTSLSPTYQPSIDDINQGTVILTLIGIGNPPCENVSDDMTLNIINQPDANAGPDDNICEGFSYTVLATASNYSTLNWTSSGTGSFTGIGTLSPTYTPSDDDITSGSVILTLEAFPLTPCVNSVTSSMQLNFQETPTAYAGADGLVCEPNQFDIIGANANNFSTIYWNSSGTGSFTNNNELETTYVPSSMDYQAGIITLTLTANAIAPCSVTATDELILTLQALPIADAGPNDVICEDESFTVSGASATNYVNLYWTTSGTGTLLGATTINPTYTPSTGDIALGLVTLTLNLQGETPCSLIAQDQMNLTIEELPTVYAGIDTSLCQGTTYTVSTAYAINWNTLQWTSTGSGSFVNLNSLTPTYTPSAADYTAGSVVLTLEVTPVSPCLGVYTDNMTLNLFETVYANAGDDATICEGNTYYIDDAIAENYSNIIWTSTGTGTFNNTGLQNPVYTPGANDITNGNVTLILTVTGINPCDFEVIDSKVLNIIQEAYANAGDDKDVCEGSYTIMDANATNFSTLLWTTDGTGILTNETTIQPTYTPSDIDLLNGFVTLTLNASSSYPCIYTSLDNVVLTYTEEPTVYAGVDYTICENQQFTVFNANAVNYNTLLWSSSGDGAFINVNTLTPTYIPGTNDISNGSAVLILTASPNPPCINNNADSMLLTITNFPNVNAGADDVVCENSTYTVYDASVSNSSNYVWSSNGDGSFTSGNTLTPTYTLGPSDITNGNVILMLTANANSPCSGQITDEKLITIQYIPVAFAGNDTVSCIGDNFYIGTASAQYYQSIFWTSSGSGIFLNNGDLDPTYIPSNADIINGSVMITLTANALSPCLNNVSSSFVLEFVDGPNVYAGVDAEICESEYYINTDASASNYSLIIWTSDGDGIFSNPNILHTNYFPGTNDINIGFVNLSLSAQGIGSCPDSSDVITIFVQKNPTANAGLDGDVCSETFIVEGATVENNSSILWTTNGTGYFNNPNSISPTYNPSTEDLTNGHVTLNLTAYALLPCIDSVQSIVTKYFVDSPIVDAGSGGIICETDVFTIIDASSSNSNTIYWTTSGDGDFSDPTILSPTYFSGTSDIDGGYVTLTLTGYNNVCDSVTDYAVLVIQKLPSVYAGPDSLVCESGSFEVIDAVVENYSSLFWISSGDGTLINNTTISPTYFPGPTDIAIGSVTLTLTASASSPCAGNYNDSFVLNIIYDPLVNAGSNDTVCEGDYYELTEAIATNTSSVIWTTNGDGTFANSSTLHTSYQPGPNDVLTGTVILTLYGINQPCSSVNSSMELTIIQLPDVYAGVDATIGINMSYTLTTATAYNYNSLQWTTTGTGIFDNPYNLNPIYTPSAYDQSLGSVNLMLEGIANWSCNNMTDVMELTIIANPTVDFYWETSCKETPVQFRIDTTITNVNSISSWYWDFGNGTYSTQMEPLCTYVNAGYYNATLTITDTINHVSVITHIVEVYELPVPLFYYESPSCFGAATQFYNSSYTPSGYITEWHWDFGDGNTTSVMFPNNPDVSHVYINTGTFNVTLTIITNQSCTKSLTSEVYIEAIPQAAFTHDATCANTPVEFMDQSSPNGGTNITSWEWNFGDPFSGNSNTSTLQNPQHLYTVAGNYNVQLIVWNSNLCSDTIISNLIIDNELVADFTFSESCLYEPTLFFPDTTIIDPGNITIWHWSFGDGTYSNSQNTSHIYASSSEYTVTLNITNIYGCEGNKSKNIIVYAPPVPMFDDLGPLCVNTPAIFIDQSYVEYGYIYTWIWNYGDGSANDTIIFPNNPNTTHLYTQEGTFNVTLTTISAQGCIASLTKEVEVNPSPIANFYFSNACQEMEVSFSDASSQGGPGSVDSWFWDFDDPLSGSLNTSTLQDPIHIFADSGNYNVMLIVSNATDCYDTIIREVVVKPKPEVNFMWNYLCKNQLTQFLIDTTVTNTQTIITYLWDFGDGQTSSEQNPEHLYEMSGNYEVILIVTNIEGCENTISHDIYVIDSPVISFVHSSPACQEWGVEFTNQSTTTSGYIVQWIWEYGDGTADTINYPDNPNTTHIYEEAGTFSVNLFAKTSDSCENNLSQNIIVSTAPVADFDYDNSCGDTPIQFVDMSSPNGGNGITQWYWNFGNPMSGSNNYSYEQNPIHTFTQAGTFDVILQVTNSGGCMDTLIKQLDISIPPPLDFFTNEPTCLGDSIEFTADTTVINTSTIEIYLWDFGDGSPVVYQQNAIHNYATWGNYDVIFTVTDTSGCENSITKEIQIAPGPEARFDFVNPCQSDSTFFTDYSFSINNEPIIEWYWDFGDPSSSNNTSTIQHPIHIFEETSSYEVKLVVTCIDGCQDSITKEVRIYELPNANFTFNAQTCGEGLVYFNDSSTAILTSVDEWYWEFENNYFSTEKDPYHIFYETDTSYNVSLTITDGHGCNDNIIKEVYVPNPLSIDFTFNQTCFEETTYFNDTLYTPDGDTLIDWEWNFGEPESGINNISEIPNPSHTYMSPGTYNVVLKGTDQHGCTETIYKDVVVLALPEPEFVYQSNICDSTVYFNDISTGGNAPIRYWIWLFGDNTSSDTIFLPDNPDISHTYSNPGFYDVTLIVANTNGCQDSIHQEVFRKYCIKADFEVLDTLLCQNLSLGFSDSSIYSDLISLWYWDFNDGFDTTYIEHSATITHKFIQAGTFDVRLIVYSTNGGETISDTIIKSINILPSPIADFSCNAVCLNEISYFNDISNTNGTELISWLWNFDDPDSVVTSSLQNPWYHYNVADSFDVKLFITAENNCYDSIIQTIAVNPLPIADFEWVNACMSKSTEFIDISDSVSGMITNWGWNFGDTLIRKDTSSLSNPVYIYDTTGTYDVRLIISNENTCIDTSIHTITVYPVPYSNFSFVENYNSVQGQLQFTNETQGGIDYFWLFGDGGDSEETDPLYQYDADGNYIIELISWNEYDCPDTMSFIYQFLFKGLFVPNAFAPENEFAGVRLFKPVGVNLAHYNINIFDSWGHLLWESDALDDTGRPSEGWDGNFKNDPMPMDVYIWRIKATFIDGSVWEGKSVGNNENGALETTGTVTLIR